MSPDARRRHRARRAHHAGTGAARARAGRDRARGRGADLRRRRRRDRLLPAGEVSRRGAPVHGAGRGRGRGAGARAGRSDGRAHPCRAARRAAHARSGPHHPRRRAHHRGPGRAAPPGEAGPVAVGASGLLRRRVLHRAGCRGVAGGPRRAPAGGDGAPARSPDRLRRSRRRRGGERRRPARGFRAGGLSREARRAGDDRGRGGWPDRDGRGNAPVRSSPRRPGAGRVLRRGRQLRRRAHLVRRAGRSARRGVRARLAPRRRGAGIAPADRGAAAAAGADALKSAAGTAQRRPIRRAADVLIRPVIVPGGPRSRPGSLVHSRAMTPSRRETAVVQAPLRARRVLVVLMPDVHLQDMAGPVQVLDEASHLGGAYQLSYCGAEGAVRSAQGLLLADLLPLPAPREGDLVLIPGTSSAKLDQLAVPGHWLRAASDAGARIASVCTGAFALARAGLLDGRRCTTHWKVVGRLAAETPRARVVDDCLFIEDGGVITSAGVSSGIDMALSLVEQDWGPLVAARVAREMVVYLRRNGQEEQRSVYLDHRTHLHPGVHRVQDWLVANPQKKPILSQLARIAAMSPRHLARVFRRATGVTPKQFAAKVKVQVARDLLGDPQRTVEAIAASCGFDDAPPLRIVVMGAEAGKSPKMIDWMRRMTTQSDVVMSVCTGACKLALTGVLEGKRATTHHEYYD